MYLKKISLLILCSTASFIPLQAQEMSFEEYNPKSTLVVPGKEVKKAKFPFIDIHSHQRSMSKQRLSGLIEDMDRLNEGIMVNLSGGSGKNLNTKIKNINASYLRNKDINGKRITVDDPRLDLIWAKCGELGIPVLIHAGDPKSFWDDMDADNERWLELKTRPGRKRSATDPAPWQQIIDEQHRMFKKHPNTKFVNAHMGWYANNLGKLGELLDEMPNMNVGIAAVIAELGRQPRFARAFFIKYQNRNFIWKG